MRIVFAPLFMATLMSATSAESPAPLLDCAFGPLEAKITACTKHIEARQLDAARMAMAHNHRGRWYVEKKEPDKALADFTSAIELDPTLSQAYYGRGLLHLKAGRKEQAIADYRKVLEYTPGDGAAREGLKILGVAPPPPVDFGVGSGPLGQMH
jgi:tetratricopeptide (TPR) repeat protein